MKLSSSIAAAVIVVAGRTAASFEPTSFTSNAVTETLAIDRESPSNADHVTFDFVSISINSSQDNEAIATRRPQGDSQVAPDLFPEDSLAKREDADDEVDRYMHDKTCGWWCIRRLTRTCGMECRNEGSKKPDCYRKCQALRLWRQKLVANGAPISWQYAVEMFKQMKLADILFDISEMEIGSPYKKRSVDENNERAAATDTVQGTHATNMTNKTISDAFSTPAAAFSTERSYGIAERDRAAVESVLSEYRAENIASLLSRFTAIQAGKTDTTFAASWTYEWMYGHPHIETRSTSTSSAPSMTTDVDWDRHQSEAGSAWLSEVFSWTASMEPEQVISLWSLFMVDMGPPRITETDAPSASSASSSIITPSATLITVSSDSSSQLSNFTPLTAPTGAPTRKFPLVTRENWN